MKKKLKVSFSSGETSAYMARRCQLELSDEYDIVYIMANTSRERQESMDFAKRCNDAWGLGLVIVEAVVHPEFGKASTHRVVDFDTTCMDGSVFEDVIKVYGIPNMDFEPCNREMKLNAMKSYMKSLGWTDYYTAIGIRMDETRRVNPKSAASNKIIYPFIDIWPTDKQDVNTFWEDQPFRLELEPHEGNCKGCFKKSDKKHFRSISERPEDYDWCRTMEKKYGFHGAPHYGSKLPEGPPARVFFRGYRSTDAMFAQASSLGYIPIIPSRELRSQSARQLSFDLDVGGCGESCEPYSMEILED